MIVRAATIAALVALAAATAGCGGNDEPSKKAAPTTTNTRTDAGRPTGPRRPLTRRERIVAKKVRVYLAAVAEPRPKAICAQLAKLVKKIALQALKQSSHLSGDDCREIIASALRDTPAKVKASFRNIRVVDVHIFGKRAGVTYEAPGLDRSTIGLIREDGVWKLSALGGTPTPPSNG